MGRIVARDRKSPLGATLSVAGVALEGSEVRCWPLQTFIMQRAGLNRGRLGAHFMRKLRAGLLHVRSVVMMSHFVHEVMLN